MACKSLTPHTFANDLGTDMVMIGVGADHHHENFEIHKKLLQAATSYYNVHLTVTSPTLPKSFLFLAEEDPKTFKLLKDWLYTGVVPKVVAQLENPNIPPMKATEWRALCAMVPEIGALSQSHFDSQVMPLTKLYLLAEKLDIQHLMNNTMDRIQDAFFERGTVVGVDLVKLVYENTCKTSPFRDLCVSMLTLQLDRSCCHLRDEIALLCREAPGFLEDMLDFIRNDAKLYHKRETGYSVLHRADCCACQCHFHVHREGEAHKGHQDIKATRMADTEHTH